MMKNYDIVGSYDNQRISTISAARTVNMFEYDDPDGKKPKNLLSTSGLVNANINYGAATGGSRGTFVFNLPLALQAHWLQILLVLFQHLWAI
jgi:hypothetical protein